MGIRARFSAAAGALVFVSLFPGNAAVNERGGENWQAEQHVVGYRLTQDDLEIGRRYPDSRQGFLDILYLQTRPPHCKRFVYDPGLKEFYKYRRGLEKEYGFASLPVRSAEKVLACVPMAVEIVGRGLELPVFVNSAFFENTDAKKRPLVKTVTDAKSLLVDHEGYHAEKVSQGYDVGGLAINHRTAAGRIHINTFLESLDEAMACYNQLRSGEISRELGEATRENAKMSMIEVNLFNDAQQYPDVSGFAEAACMEWEGVEFLTTPKGLDVRFKFLGKKD